MTAEKVDVLIVLFVTSAAVNSTRTIQALALYIADSIKGRLSNLFD